NAALTKAQFGVGQNVEFDYKIIGAEFFRKEIENNLQEIPKADTMIFGTDFCQLQGGKNGKFKSPKLEEIYEKLYGYQFEEAYDAADEVKATAQCVIQMMRIGVIDATDLKISEEIIQENPSIYPERGRPFEILIRRQVTALRETKA